MKKNFSLLFFVFTLVLFVINVAIVVIFSVIHMEDSFYNSLDVAALSISFFSFIASSFFSLSVYLQSKEQGKINESLPKKDDQYITANYSLFNIEKEISFFPVKEDEVKLIKDRNSYFKRDNTSVDAITRIVFLPSDSINIPTYKVILKSITCFSKMNEELYKVVSEEGIDGEYSPNVLQRGYNCICADLGDSFSCIETVISKTDHIELEVDIISVFNVKMSIKFMIYLEEEKDVESNPDKEKLGELKTYVVHHCNYIIGEKSVLV